MIRMTRWSVSVQPSLTPPYGTLLTQAYMCRRTGEGMSKSEVIRCLKRYVAREVFTIIQKSAALVSKVA